MKTIEDNKREDFIYNLKVWSIISIALIIMLIEFYFILIK